MFRKMIFAILAVACVWACFVILKTPQADRDWAPEMSRLSGVSEKDGMVHFANLRNWTWRREGEAVQSWQTASFDVSKVSGLRFYIEPFPAYRGIAHTFLVFEFEEESGYAPIGVSVEARRVKGEKFSAVGGVFNRFELIYIWGTEKDLVSQSWSIKEQQRGYQLNVSAEQAQYVFRAMVRDTIMIEKEPRFYNSLFHNCTSELANSINEKAPDTLPWDISYILTGFTDKFLAKKGFIAGDVSDEAVLVKQQKLHDAVTSAAALTPLAFSKEIKQSAL